MTRVIGVALERVDKSLRVVEALTLEDHVSRSILTERILATLAGFFSALAVGLACVGIYGVMAFQVARRRKEIGIRLALGASPRTVVAGVLGETARLVAAGSVIGIAGAFALTRLAEKTLFGVKATDPLTFAAAAAGLSLLAMGAAYLPGRSAARLSPVETLRCD
jgi:ABC-type antimicrobial peptide transport system permease subunit